MLFNAAITEEQVGYIYSLNYRAKGGRQNALRRYPGTPDASRLPSSLVGFWPLDGDGSDLGPHSMTGTQTGGCFTTGYHEAVEVCGQNWVAGKYRIALNFKGDDGFIVSDPSNALASINAAVTMAAWVRPSQYEVCGDRGIIMNKESSFEFGVEANSGALQGAKNEGCWRWWGNVRLSLWDWTQTAVAFDGSDEIHYVNGIMMESDPCVGPVTVNDNPLRIGARANIVSAGGGDYWSQFLGDIDEAMVFDSALTTREISGIYRATYRSGAVPLPVDSSEPSMDALRQGTGATANGGGKMLVGFWPLEGDGQDLTDSATVDNAGMDFGGNNLGLTPTNAQYTTGVYGQAFRFTGSDMLEVTEASPLLDCDFVTMAAWIHPVHYDVSADRGIIMNKECVHKPSRRCRFHR